jgi:hypothetical protein
MTGRQEPTTEVLLERLVSRHAHLVGRGSPRVGFASDFLKKQGSNSTDAAWALLLFHSLLNSLLVSSRKKASVRNAAELDTNTGFSPVDLAALEENTPTLTTANTPTDADSLGLDIETNDVGYVATVQMGTPPRDFNILMDSGSADLWVGAEGCLSSTTSGADCVSDLNYFAFATLIPLDMQGNHTFLGTASSSSFVNSNQPFQVTYGTGAVSGDIVQDNVAFAGLQLPGHTFGVALLETDDFTGSPFDGLMGLAQSSLSQQQTLTPVESLAQAGSIKEAITSFKISRLADQKNDGEVTFGGLDPAKFNPATLVTLNNVNTQGFWEASLDAATVDGKDLGFTNRTTILDTGTTLLVMPATDAQTVHNAIPGAKSDKSGGFTVPCTLNSSVALTFGGKSFAIDPRDITFAPVDPTNPTGDCVSGISSGQIGGPDEWLAGDVFLKNAYFSTDVGKNTIQLAQLT